MGQMVSAPPQTGSRFRPWVRRNEAWLLLVLVGLISLGLPLALAFLTGSIAIPHNDAWSHTRIAEGFAQGDGFQLLGWNRTALLGQVAVLGPLGLSITAQHVFVSLAALAGLVATFFYLDSRVDRRRAVLGTVLVGVVPDFGLLATSYMSDIPAFAAMLICLALADVAFRRHSVWILGFAVLVGVWGVTIREQALVAPVAVVITAFSQLRDRRWAVVALGLVALGAVVAFEVWRRSLPFGDPPWFTVSARAPVVVAVMAAITLAFFLAPALALVARPSLWSFRARTAGVAAGVVGVAAWVKWDSVVLGNYLAPGGAYSAAVTGTREVFGPIAWAFICVAAVASLAVLAGVLVHHGLRLDRMSAVYAALLVAGTLAQSLIGQSVFSRYLLPLVPVAAYAVLRVPASPRWARSGVAVSLMVALSLAVSSSAMAFDAARWEVAKGLEASGVSATDIDAGLEWVGYHSPVPASQEEEPDLAPDVNFYMRMFPKSRQCYVVSSSPLSEGSLVRTEAFRSFALAGSSTLWIYQFQPCR